nr:hypothetical protein [Tanacetum cinerariifolium]
MLDQTFDRIQKLVSQLELLGENLSQEDVNQKFLRSLSPEWNTHVVEWRNKADLDTMSMDDLYNNLQVYELEVKGISSSSSSTQNMTFVSSSNNNTSSTNGIVYTAQAVNTAHEVTTTSTQINAAYSINIDNLSDAVICSFFASQPNSHQLIHEDLEQIHLDYMEEIDLRYVKKLLEAVEKRFGGNAATKKTQRNILKQQYENFTASSSKMRNRADLDTMSMDDLYNNLKKLAINGNKTIGFDKSKVECYNCHKKGHFAKECRALKNQDNKHKESSRRSVPVETPASIALVSCDGLCGYDWSDRAEEGPNYALMDFSSSSFDLKVTRKFHASNTDLSYTDLDKFVNKPVAKAKSSDDEPQGNPQMDLHDQEVIDNGCSRHMTRNMSYLIHNEEIDEGYVAFGRNPNGGKIIGKYTIKTGNIDFKNVYFVR